MVRAKGVKKIAETIHVVGRVKVGLFDKTRRCSGCDLVENPQIVKQKTPRLSMVSLDVSHQLPGESCPLWPQMSSIYPDLSREDIFACRFALPEKEVLRSMTFKNTFICEK